MKIIFGASLFRPVGVWTPPCWLENTDLLLSPHYWEGLSLLERIKDTLAPLITGDFEVLNAGWFGERLLVFFSVCCQAEHAYTTDPEKFYWVWDTALTALRTGRYDNEPVCVVRDTCDDQPGVFMYGGFIPPELLALDGGVAIPDEGPLPYEEAQAYIALSEEGNDRIRKAASEVLQKIKRNADPQK